MEIKFNKSTGLVPVIIQNYKTLQVLMLGYMNDEALQKTKNTKRVTFFSRSKNRLWTKGETSGNYLDVKDIRQDCDNDALLIKVASHGPTCHTGATSCFKEDVAKGFIYELEHIVNDRIETNDPASYTNALFKKGINKVAQKVGEEAFELVIESKDNDDVLFINEAADLLYHYMILLKAKGFKLEAIEAVLKERNQK